MSNLIRGVQGNNLAQICPQLLYYYSKRTSKGRHFPAYRDILFLALVAAGRESMETCKHL